MQDNFEIEEHLRIRKIKDNRYLPKGLVNAYVDNRLNSKAKKQFENLVGDIENLKEELRVKTEVQEFMKELIPNPQISKTSLSHLKAEMADITDSVIGDQKKSITQKISSFLDMTVFEF